MTLKDSTKDCSRLCLMCKNDMKEDRPKKTPSGSSSNCSGLDPLTNHPSISNVRSINNQVELPPYQKKRTHTHTHTHALTNSSNSNNKKLNWQFRFHWVLVSSPLLEVMISWLLLSTWMTKVLVLRAQQAPCFPWMPRFDRWIQQRRRSSASAPAARRAPCFAATHRRSFENFAATIANPVFLTDFFWGRVDVDVWIKEDLEVAKTSLWVDCCIN